jgi:predicted enzyme related to lactoylglutathione lyase
VQAFCGLQSPTWRLTLVQTANARASTEPATRRSQTPIKLAFAAASIEALRPLIERHGGRLEPAEAQWSFRGGRRIDGIDPEGNVFQLVQN